MAMDSEIVMEEQMHKKGRHRKKQLYNAIMQQMEFYFSDSNLSKDKFLLPLIQNDPFVDISIFLKFNKILKLTSNADDIIKAVSNSQLLELSEDKTSIKRKTEFNMKNNVDNCTLYIERIKVDATHEWLSTVFSEFGNVTYVSIPKYKHKQVNKGFAFVEFEKESELVEALNYFESIGCKMSTLTPPENLCSILTYEGTNDLPSSYNETENEGTDESFQKKRKHSLNESENCTKKIKTNTTTDTDNGESVRTDDFEEKRKKKQKKMRRKIFKELGLQVLSRVEWKKIRNRYLDNQRAKMKQLKQFLHKKKYSNRPEIKQKIENKNVKDPNKNVEEDKIEKLEFTPGVIVKTQLSEPYPELKIVKEELQEYSSEIKYVDVSPTSLGNEIYIRFSDNDSANKFCSSNYKGQTEILQGKEEEEYWNKIHNDRSLKLKKNKKRLRGREKLLKKAEKELGKHIKFEDAD